MDNVISGDETWIFQYDPETKRQSAEWHTQKSPRPKKARMSKSKIKTMLIVFFDRRGIVQKECAFWDDRKCCILNGSTDTPAKSHHARATSPCEELETSP